MRATIAAILVPLLLLLGCNDGSESPKSPTDPLGPPVQAVLTGRTLDPAGNPVAAVVLTLYADDRVAATATSRADGSFTFEPVAPRAYGLSLRVDGSEQGVGMVRLLPGLNPRDVLVTRCLIPYGTVRDSVTGRPIAGVRVTLFGRESITDGEGRYRLDFGCAPVPGSTIILRAEHPDYETFESLMRASGLCSCSHDIVLVRR